MNRNETNETEPNKHEESADSRTQPQKQSKQGSKRTTNRTKKSKETVFSFDPKDLRKQIEELQKKENGDRSETIRRLLRKALTSETDIPNISITYGKSYPTNRADMDRMEECLSLLYEANEGLLRNENALRRLSVGPSESSKREAAIKAIGDIAHKYGQLYTDLNSGLPAYLHLIPPKELLQAIDCHERGKASPFEKCLISMVFKK